MSSPAPVVSENIPTTAICVTGILIVPWESTVLLDAGVREARNSSPDPVQTLFSKHKN